MYTYKSNFTTSLGNIDRNLVELAVQAGEETGFNIWITDDATDSSGRIPLPDLVQLHSDSNKDHGSFWKRFNELQVTK